MAHQILDSTAYTMVTDTMSACLEWRQLRVNKQLFFRVGSFKVVTTTTKTQRVIRKKKTFRFDYDEGYVFKVNAHDPRNHSANGWYLLHHPLINPNKPGKFRRALMEHRIFHASSLSKVLRVGPDMLQNHIAVLMRFRQHKYAVSADIEGTVI